MNTQQKILELVKNYYAARKEYPTAMDLSKVLRMKEITIIKHLRALNEKGEIGYRKRAITWAKEKTTNWLLVPLI